MNTSAIFRGGKSRILALILAITVVAGALTASMQQAEASPNRSHLRPGCVFDSYQYWVQICQVYSPSMDTNIPVQIVPSRDGGNKALYLLDGLRAPLGYSDWTWEGGAPKVFEDSNLNIVMPGGGTASFWADWKRPSTTIDGRHFNYKFETFLAHELPQYLNQHFGISYGGNSIGGLSMGASAAMALGYNYPEKFNQVLAFSGYLHTTAPGMSAAIAAAQADAGGYNSIDMWGMPGSAERVRNDPYLNIEKMKTIGDIYIASASGVPDNVAKPEILYTLPGMVPGIGLEAFSRASTIEFERAARAKGLDFTVNYSPTGIHVWQLWERNLWEVKERVLNWQGAW